MRKTSIGTLAVLLLGSWLLRHLFRQRRRISFRDRVVLITGGSRGLGLCLARRFGAEGARLFLVARDPEELARAATELKQRDVQVEIFAGDVCDPGTPAAVVSMAIAAFGRVDVLVNNAGIITVGPLENMTEADYEATMATHFWAPLRMMTAARPQLQTTRGRIVNIVSIGGLVPVPHLAPYGASKFALAGLSETFRSELLSDEILVTSVFPGLLRTGSHVQARFKGQTAKEFAWFVLGSATGLTSISAERAAGQIVEACRYGLPRLVISVPAKLLALARALAPAITGSFLSIAARFLPGPNASRESLPGAEARGGFPPRLMTVLPDRASDRNNENLPAT